jgi:hypothetical protein
MRAKLVYSLGLAIFVIVLSVNLRGDYLRDWPDPACTDDAEDDEGQPFDTQRRPTRARQGPLFPPPRDSIVAKMAKCRRSLDHQQ